METTRSISSCLDTQLHYSPQAPAPAQTQAQASLVLDFNNSFSNLNTLLLLRHHQTVPKKLMTHRNTINTTTTLNSSSSFLSLGLGFLQETPITKPKPRKSLISMQPSSSSSSSLNYKFRNQTNPSNNSSLLLLSSTSLSIENPSKRSSSPISNSSSRSSLFSSTSLSSIETLNQSEPTSRICCPNPPSLPTQSNPSKVQSKTLMKALSVLEKSMIGACAGGVAGAFTYACLHPLDTIKTKLQTKGASQIYSSALDAVAKTFQAQGVLGFYSGVSAVIVGSAASSSVYFGTCEFGKSILSKLPHFPSILIPPTAGAMGNIASSAIMVPKELITQRMQAGAASGRSWQVLLRILERDGVLGLYAGYSATLLRNLPAGVLSYSSFEYLKSAVLSRTGKDHLEPLQSVCCGALAGAISASLTTPLDVVKTRLMTQVPGETKSKIVASVYGGVSATVRQILKEEGWVGLTRGIGPRVLHSACFAALGYFAFETARLMLLHQYVARRKDEMETVGACL